MLDKGLPALGCCPWSFVGVVSSRQGFATRYGLVINHMKQYGKGAF